MTLPDERYRALRTVRPFMYWLMTTPIRKFRRDELRLRVRALLKHYPVDYEIERMAEKVPELLSKR